MSQPYSHSLTTYSLRPNPVSTVTFSLLTSPNLDQLSLSWPSIYSSIPSLPPPAQQPGLSGCQSGLPTAAITIPPPTCPDISWHTGGQKAQEPLFFLRLLPLFIQPSHSISPCLRFPACQSRYAKALRGSQTSLTYLHLFHHPLLFVCLKRITRQGIFSFSNDNTQVHQAVLIAWFQQETCMEWISIRFSLRT